MTALQKLNRRRWPTWARIALLAMAASVVVVLVWPSIAESVDTSESGVTPVAVKHTGGDAVEDCGFAESYEGQAAGFISAFAFTVNPAQAIDPLEVTDANGVVIPGYTVEITSPGVNDPDTQNGQSLDWALVHNGVTVVQSDGGLVAPKDKNLSHASFCFTEVDDGVYIVAYVEIKGSRDTNHYTYLLSFDCGERVPVATEYDYDVTLNCVPGKTGANALFSQFDTSGDGKADTIALISYGTGTAFYVEHLSFEAQADTNLADVAVFVLRSDDSDPQDGADAVITPECLFNPDLANDGVENGLVETDSGDPAYAGNALPFGASTCYFNASFEQTAEGLWIPTYDLLNEGDGWRTIY